jgi:hypothetical protein
MLSRWQGSAGHTKSRLSGVYEVMVEKAEPPRICRPAVDCMAFAATTLTVLSGYLLTLAPQVTLGFSGIFSTAAMYGGVPHPPGYPVAVLWQQAFVTLLPVSNVAWRVAVSSAVAGALASGLIAAMVSRFGVELLTSMEPRPAVTRIVCGWSAGMIFGFNGAFWGRAVIADVWTLTILLLTVVIFLIQRWSFTPQHKRLLYLACFTYGLTLTNSQIMLAAASALPALVAVGNRELARDILLVGCAVFAAGLIEGCTGVFDLAPDWKLGSLFPLHILVGLAVMAAAIILVVKTRRVLTEWKGVLGCATAFTLGLLPYLYVPVSSMTNPPMNWGYARTTGGFFHVVSRGQYERVIPTANVRTFAKQMGTYARSAATDFGWLYLPFACVPWIAYRRLSPSLRSWMCASLVLFASLSLLMVVALNPPTHADGLRATKVLFSASYMVVAVWTGCGLLVLVGKIRSDDSSRCIHEDHCGLI